MKQRDPQTGLLYNIASQSVDYGDVSIKVAAPCLPTEAVNKEYVDGLENRLSDLIKGIQGGLSAEDVAKLLQPIKDALTAFQIDDDSALTERVRQLEETVAHLIKSGIGTTTVIYQGSILKYYNLGLGDISYKDIVLCGRTIVETQIEIDLNLGKKDFTPISLRRVSSSRKHAETLEMPLNEVDDSGKIILYFQGAHRYSVGEMQLVVAVDDDSWVSHPPNAQSVEVDIASPALVAEIDPVIKQPISEAPAETMESTGVDSPSAEPEPSSPKV